MSPREQRCAGSVPRAEDERPASTHQVEWSPHGDVWVPATLLHDPQCLPGLVSLRTDEGREALVESRWVRPASLEQEP